MVFSISGLSVGSLLGCHSDSQCVAAGGNSLISELGPLLPADANGVRLPSGFTSRIVARSGSRPFAGSAYLWHDAPDGGATFRKGEGWIYVSNSEVGSGLGGAGAIEFNRDGLIVQAYPILEGTSRNCAGGATPWNSWLSCEEREKGIVWECDPEGMIAAAPRPDLGAFAHEAVAVDLETGYLYMTEDRTDGGLYRYIPSAYDSDGNPVLSGGNLQIASMDKIFGGVNWLSIPDPQAISEPTRYQQPSAIRFDGGEGIVYYDDDIIFATKGDNRIWKYDTRRNELLVLYDDDRYDDPVLTGVDNITLSRDGEPLVAEDGGDLQIVAITRCGDPIPVVQLVGHDSSEITGPAFSPDGKRLYFSSQRGVTGSGDGGMTFEVSGPFHV